MSRLAETDQAVGHLERRRAALCRGIGVRDAAPRTLFKQEGIESQRVQFSVTGRRLSTGFVHVRITDKTGQFLQAGFEIIHASRVPSLARSLQQSKVPDHLPPLLQADFLIKQDANR